MIEYLKSAFTEILQHWRGSLINFSGNPDHVHLEVDIHPALNISTLINNLKTASSRRIRGRFAQRLAQFYPQPVLWHRGYFVASVGVVTPEMIRQYVEQQCTKPRPRRPKESL